jgi:hypothetical protein
MAWSSKSDALTCEQTQIGNHFLWGSLCIEPAWVSSLEDVARANSIERNQYDVDGLFPRDDAWG